MYNVTRWPIDTKNFEITIKEDCVIEVVYKNNTHIFKYQNCYPVVNSGNINFSGDNKMAVSTTYRNFRNLLMGLVKPFEKIVTLTGTGYYIKMDNNTRVLEIEVGYSHKVYVDVPENISVEPYKKSNNQVIILCSNPQILGNFIFNKIEKLRRYNPYTQKGITVSGNTYIPKKSGKKK